MTCAEMDLQKAIDDGAFVPHINTNFYTSTYQDAEQREITFIRLGPLRAGVTEYDALSYLYFSGYESASDLLAPCPATQETAGGYSQTGFAVQPSQPADWDLHCRDYYYTQEVQNSPDYGTLTYYRGIYDSTTPPTWPAGVTVYKNDSLRALFYTANNNYFGAYRGLHYDSNTHMLKYLAGAAHGNGNTGIPGEEAYTVSWADARLGGITGTTCNSYSSAGTNYYIGTNGVGADALPGTPDKLRLIPVHFVYSDTEYIGIMTLELAADGLPAYATMAAWSINFYTEGAGPSGDPGDWGEITGGIRPGAQAAINVNVGMSGIPQAFQATAWGGTGYGIHAWVFNDADYAQLNKKIWEKNFLDRIKNFGRNPGDGILSVHMVPWAMGAKYGTTQDISLHVSSYGVDLGGYLPLNPGEGHFRCIYPTERIYDVDLGQCIIPDVTGKFTSYQGATCELYLPFCGMYTLDIKKVMRGTLYVKYRIDLFNGDCIAYVELDQSYPDGETRFTESRSLLLTAQGNCAFLVPFAYTDGGLQNKIHALSGALSAVLSASSGNVGGVISGGMSLLQAGGERISTSTSTGSAGTFGHRRPFVWIKYPVPLNPSSLQGTAGHMSGWGGTVGAGDDGTLGGVGAYGYQQYSSVDVSGIPCTAEEADEIEALLKTGVFLGGATE